MKTYTHTLNIYGELMDVRLVAKTYNDQLVWESDNGRHYFDVHLYSDILPIAGKSSEHAENLLRVESQRPIAELFDLEMPSYFLSKQVPHKIDDQGRIVSTTGEPWTRRYSATKALQSLNLEDTHAVAGYGNDGPNGREWWVEKKTKIWLPSIEEAGMIRYSDTRQHSILFEHGQNLEGLLFESRLYKSQWGFKFSKARRMMGFETSREMLLFLMLTLMN